MTPFRSFLEKTTVNCKLIEMDNPIKFQDNYFCFDNLQIGFDPKVNACRQQGNEDYHIVIAVQQGSMGLIINGQEVRLKSNDFLLIMPFTKVEVLTSRCSVFCCVIRNYIALDMYNKIGCPDNIVENCYTFHHYHFHPQQLEIMLHDYLRIKDIMLRNAPSLHEEMLKAGIGIFMSHMFSFLAVNSRIEYKSPLFHRQVFDKFLRALSEHYKEERKVDYYAKLLDLPSKQITIATHKYAGKTASRVINEYVIFKVRAVLYNNQLSVKTVSAMFNFPNQSFFGRYFKRVTGYSPAKFLKMHSKKLSKQTPEEKTDER
jgi:AraC-like DNA-binding protein